MVAFLCGDNTEVMHHSFFVEPHGSAPSVYAQSRTSSIEPEAWRSRTRTRH